MRSASSRAPSEGHMSEVSSEFHAVVPLQTGLSGDTPWLDALHTAQSAAATAHAQALFWMRMRNGAFACDVNFTPSWLPCSLCGQANAMAKTRPRATDSPS